MWHLTYKGKPFGKPYRYKQDAMNAFIRMFPVMLGLGWGFKSGRKRAANG